MPVRNVDDSILRVGIDLGTTNTVVHYRKGIRKGFLNLGDLVEEYSMPSAVLVRRELDGSERLIAGRIALNSKFTYPERLITSSKTSLGKNKKYPDASQNFVTELTPEDVATEILKKVKACLVREGLCTPDEAVEAVITVPAMFTDRQKDETMNAGKRAGFNVRLLLQEPVAAATEYIESTERHYDHIFVVDFGGGTLDLSYLRYVGDDPEMSRKGILYDAYPTYGDNHLGGDNFDQHLVAYFKRKIGDDLGRDVSTAAAAGMNETDYRKKVEALLYAEAERVKIKLSVYTSRGDEKDEDNGEEVSLHMPCFGESYYFETFVTLADFYECCADLFKRFQRNLAKFFNENARKIDIDNVKYVMLVGGTCHIPKIRFIVEDTFGVNTIYGDLMRAVAKGAWEVCEPVPDDRVLGPDPNPNPFNPGGGVGKIKMQSHKTSDFGVKTTDMDSKKKIFSVIAAKGSVYPTENEEDNRRAFRSVSVNAQSVDIDIYERYMDVTDNAIESAVYWKTIRVDSGFELSKEGYIEIDVYFIFDESGVLNVKIFDRISGRMLKDVKNIQREDEVAKEEDQVPPMNFFLLMDVSGSMDGRPLEEAKQAIYSLSHDIVDMNVHRVGVYAFSTKEKHKRIHNLTHDANSLMNAVNTMVANGGTYAVDAIKEATRDLGGSSNSVIITVTDGGLFEEAETQAASNVAIASGIRMISIGVGSGVVRDNLRKVASSDQDVYTIRNMSELGEQFRKIIRSLCELN